MIIFAIGVFLFTSCSKKVDKLNIWINQENKVKILSTISQIGDLASEIGGERASCLILIEGGLDPHSYELVKGDDEKLTRADIIFFNGLGLEHGASLHSSLKSHSRAIAVGDRIAEANPQFVLKRKGALDPHLWMDVSLWREAVDPIAEALISFDPEGEDYYRQRAKALRMKMDETHKKIIETIGSVPEKRRYLVTSHDAFQYFAKRYLAGSAAPEGLAPDGQLSPIDIRRIIEFVKEHQITVLFPESNVSRDSIAKIASAGREMDLEIHICSEPLYGDASGGLTYLEMMEKNGSTIARNLK